MVEQVGWSWKGTYREESGGNNSSRERNVRHWSRLCHLFPRKGWEQAEHFFFWKERWARDMTLEELFARLYKLET